jgi:hypothetical protein
MKPLGGTSSPVNASTYSLGGVRFNGSLLENATIPGLVGVAAVDRRSGWWRFGGGHCS